MLGFMPSCSAAWRRSATLGFSNMVGTKAPFETRAVRAPLGPTPLRIPVEPGRAFRQSSAVAANRAAITSVKLPRTQTAVSAMVIGAPCGRANRGFQGLVVWGGRSVQPSLRSDWSLWEICNTPRPPAQPKLMRSWDYFGSGTVAGLLGSDTWMTRYLSGCVVLALREIACSAFGRLVEHLARLQGPHRAVVDLHLVGALRGYSRRYGYRDGDAPGCRCRDRAPVNRTVNRRPSTSSITRLNNSVLRRPDGGAGACAKDDGTPS